MQYDITITFTVFGLKDKHAAHEFGVSLAEHVFDTFNDDGSIGPAVEVRSKRKGRE